MHYGIDTISFPIYDVLERNFDEGKKSIRFGGNFEYQRYTVESVFTPFHFL